MGFQFRAYNYQVLRTQGEIIEHGKVVGECPECGLMHGANETKCGRCGFILDKGMQDHIDDKNRELGTDFS